MPLPLLLPQPPLLTTPLIGRVVWGIYGVVRAMLLWQGGLLAVVVGSGWAGGGDVRRFCSTHRGMRSHGFEWRVRSVVMFLTSTIAVSRLDL